MHLTGGNQLTIDVAGDYQRSEFANIDPKASADARLHYNFMVTKKDPAAPDYPVPFLISGRVHASATKGANANTTPFARAWITYKHPSSPNSEILVSATAGLGGPVDRTFEGLRLSRPIRSVRSH